MQKKYGKFYLRDYWSGWFATCIFVTMVFFGLFFDLPSYLLVFPMLFAVYFPISILIPNQECFFIENNNIFIKKLKKVKVLPIPDNCIIIIAYADFLPLGADRFATANKTYMLSGRYSISILPNNSFEYVLDKLHMKYLKKYTTNTVEGIFNNYFDSVYSFVCNDEQLNEFIMGRECKIIIPETLMHKIHINNTDNVTVFCDKGF